VQKKIFERGARSRQSNAWLYTGLFTRGVLLNFYFAATNNTMAVTTKSNVLCLLN
jgi:uncharacterized protein YbcV (DUF1398 family)